MTMLPLGVSSKYPRSCKGLGRPTSLRCHQTPQILGSLTVLNLPHYSNCYLEIVKCRSLARSQCYIIVIHNNENLGGVVCGVCVPYPHTTCEIGFLTTTTITIMGTHLQGRLGWEEVQWIWIAAPTKPLPRLQVWRTMLCIDVMIFSRMRSPYLNKSSSHLDFNESGIRPPSTPALFGNFVPRSETHRK